MMDSDARVIDSNELVESKLKEAAAIQLAKEEALQGGEEGFNPGLDSEVVDALLAKDGGESVMKSVSLKEEKAELEQEIEEANEKLEELKAQADQMIKEAEEQIEKMRVDALSEAKEQGYQSGYEEGMAQVQALKDEYIQEKENLEKEYESILEELEPQFIENLAGIYEHIFKVDLSGYDQIVTNLLIDTMQKMNYAKSFIVHVSKKDYPKVSAQKGRIQEETGTLADNLEIITDVTLSDAQCMIETEGGIYDCSLGTELEELKRKLRLLSYRKM
ncbi:FliH/SctL family protein [Parablautia muri]|nr:FliH/SctL family protein [Parablautia muri]